MKLKCESCFWIKKKYKKKNKKTHMLIFLSCFFNDFFFFAYHYECLKKETEIEKKCLKEHDGILMCNLGQPCLWLKNQQFIDDWFKKYAETYQM